MQKPRTHFEMVPVAVAKRGAATEGRKRANSVPCVICSSPVTLESCKIDEEGDAVHEKCYVARVALNPTLRSRPRSRP